MNNTQPKINFQNCLCGEFGEYHSRTITTISGDSLATISTPMCSKCFKEFIKRYQYMEPKK